jgi:hypothetical protein
VRERNKLPWEQKKVGRGCDHPPQPEGMLYNC